MVPSKQQHVVAVAICLPSSCARPLEPRRVGETLPGKSTVACIFSLIPGKVSPDLPVRCVYVYTRESVSIYISCHNEAESLIGNMDGWAKRRNWRYVFRNRCPKSWSNDVFRVRDFHCFTGSVQHHTKTLVLRVSTAETLGNYEAETCNLASIDRCPRSLDSQWARDVRYPPPHSPMR